MALAYLLSFRTKGAFSFLLRRRLYARTPSFFTVLLHTLLMNGASFLIGIKTAD